MSATASAPPPTAKSILHLMKVWCACLIGPETLVIALCIFRLQLRIRTNRLWWDDYFALLASVVVIPFFATTWMILIVQELSQSITTAIFWTHLAVQVMVVCLARISLALSIARILSPTSRVFRIIIVFNWIYALCCIASIFQFFAFPGYIKSNGLQYSNNTKSFNIIFLPYITDLGSDLFLVGLTLSQFWNVRLRSRGARMLVLTGFCASLLVSPVALVIGLLTILPVGLTIYGLVNRTMCTHLLVILALLACNFLVVTSYVYQLVHQGDDELASELSALSQKPTSARSSRRMTHSDAPSDSYNSELETRTGPLVLTDIESDWSTSQLRHDSSKEPQAPASERAFSSPSETDGIQVVYLTSPLDH